MEHDVAVRVAREHAVESDQMIMDVEVQGPAVAVALGAGAPETSAFELPPQSRIPGRSRPIKLAPDSVVIGARRRAHPLTTSTNQSPDTVVGVVEHGPLLDPRVLPLPLLHVSVLVTPSSP